MDLPQDSLSMQESDQLDGVLRNGFTGTLFGRRGIASIDNQLWVMLVGGHLLYSNAT